jgi:Uma2 family endonuclease
MTTLKLPIGTRLTVDQFLDLPETDDKPILELDDGELYIMPRPRRLHQFV